MTLLPAAVYLVVTIAVTVAVVHLLFGRRRSSKRGEFDADRVRRKK